MKNVIELSSDESESTTEFFAAKWSESLAGDERSRSQWRAHQGNWVWQPDGFALQADSQWASCAWHGYGPQDLKALGSVVIGLTLSGTAEAAGLSFGDYKDFLTPLNATRGRRNLQLEVDFATGCWRFCVDGQLQSRVWWDSAIRSVDDFLNGTLALKAKGTAQVLFEDLTFHAYSSACRISVVMTCFRFAARLRVSLRNWCHQTLPSGAFEVLVVNPGSPDGAREHLEAVACSFPHVRIREIPVDSKLAKNKGAMINQAVRASRGEWIWLTDADCVFAPTAAAEVLKYLQGHAPRLFHGQRRHLSGAQTAAMLSGRFDAVRDFEEICRQPMPRAPENLPWGYTQIVSRRVLEQHPYDETINHFAHSDGMFVDKCKRAGIRVEQIPGLFCLHLEHPFAWYGTDMFL